jgi:2'-5' RNA ligase
MKRIRTFIAIDPGKHIRDRLVALQESLMQAGADAKWVEHDNLHVTLLFLGEVEMTAISEVCGAVAEAVTEFATFNMSVEHAGCFPNPRRPRVLWAGVTEGAREIIEIHDAMEAPLLDLGCYRREERKYTPHLTLGRVRGDRHHSDLGSVLARYADWKGGEAAVTAVHVMGSELTPQGPVYTVLSRAKLS